MREMMNVDENRGLESPLRYAMLESILDSSGNLRDFMQIIKFLHISHKLDPPDANSTKPPSNHHSKAIRSHRSHPGSSQQVLIVVLTAELRLIRIISLLSASRYFATSILSVINIKTMRHQDIYRRIVSSQNKNITVRKELDTGPMEDSDQPVRQHLSTSMADRGEQYIYQRFPHVIVDGTPSSSSGFDSDPSEASTAASQAPPAERSEGKDVAAGATVEAVVGRDLGFWRTKEKEDGGSAGGGGRRRWEGGGDDRRCRGCREVEAVDRELDEANEEKRLEELKRAWSMSVPRRGGTDLF
ncbi:hypothetical protein E3N88_18835 [Mikania micrantha]|uniref:Uncharacterized protein n=1 Tax=Mikania micrantha TaxID=192012 RepID=A0A5N6NMX7_9ASTR|nr:hypothetical protein E3N88_18835 [Mikania micrantha]